MQRQDGLTVHLQSVHHRKRQAKGGKVCSPTLKTCMFPSRYASNFYVTGIDSISKSTEAESMASPKWKSRPSRLHWHSGGGNSIKKKRTTRSCTENDDDDNNNNNNLLLSWRRRAPLAGQGFWTTGMNCDWSRCFFFSFFFFIIRPSPPNYWNLFISTFKIFLSFFIALLLRLL